MLLSLTHFELSSRTQSSEASCHTEVLSSHQEFTESFVSFRSLQSFSEEVCNVVTSTNVTDLQHHVFDVVSNSEPSDLEILAAAQSPDSCPPSRARRRRHARARCAPSRGIVWRNRCVRGVFCGSSTNPPLSLFSSRVVWSYGKKVFNEFAVEIPHAPHPQANQRNPRAMRPLTPAHRRPLALWLVCRAERPARVAARDPRARSPARRRPVDRRERGAPLAFFLVPIGTVHHESGNQRESALSSRCTAPFPRLK